MTDRVQAVQWAVRGRLTEVAVVVQAVDSERTSPGLFRE